MFVSMEENNEEKENKHDHKKIHWLTRWQAATFVLIIAIAILIPLSILTKGFTGMATAELTKEQVGQKVANYLEEFLAAQGYKSNVTVLNITEANGLYNIKLLVGQMPLDSYATKDGNLFFPQAINLSMNLSNLFSEPEEETQEVPKSDKPVVELFVMTHCPYGLQAEKGMLPAAQALGNKINFTIRFVHYFMHGEKEEQETYRQVCIREEQPAKYLDYLKCFIEDGNSSRCISALNLSTESIDACMTNRAKQYYASDSALSQKYDVAGSPTLVINGVQAEFYPRSPANALSVICSAFTTPPSECNATLSTTNPSPGFGWSGSSSSAGSC
jgi:hypothetical protein